MAGDCGAGPEAAPGKDDEGLTVEEKVDRAYPMYRETLREVLKKEGYVDTAERTNLAWSFFGTMDYESKCRYMGFISFVRMHPEREMVSKPLDPICGSRFLRKENAEFINGLEGESQFIYYSAVVNTGEVDLLTRKDVQGFIGRLDGKQREAYLVTLSRLGREGEDYSDMRKMLTNERMTCDEKVSRFINSLSFECACDYFGLIAQSDTEQCVEAYVGEKVLGGRDFIEYACSNVDSHPGTFFRAVGVLNLGMGSVAKENAPAFEAARRFWRKDATSYEPEPAQYINIVNDHLKREYGLNAPLTLRHIKILTDSAGCGIEPAPVIELANSSGAYEDMVAYPIPSPLYDRGYSKAEVVRCAVIAATEYLCNRDELPGEVSVMAKYLGQKEVNRANNEFYHADKVTRANVFGLREKGDFTSAYKALCEYAKAKDGPLSDLLESVSSIAEISASNQIVAFESRNPLDFSSYTQPACVFLPSGHRIDKGILTYVGDKDVHLLDFTVGGIPRGAAITFVSDRTLVVDSVEGGWMMRKPDALAVMNEYVLHRAGSLGAERVLYFTESPNLTAKAFVKMLRTSGFGTESRIDMDPPGTSYLEAKRGSPAIEHKLVKSA